MNAPIPVEVPKITRCLRVEIIKPLNVTWDEAGSLLRSQRAVMHRLMNAAVLGYLDDRHLQRGEKAEVSVYLRVKEALDGYRDWARKHKDQGVKRFADVDVGTGIQSAIAQIGADAYQKWRKGKGNERIPSFGKGQPIPVRAQESRIRKDPKGFVLECKLVSGSGPWHQFALAPSSGRHHEILRNLAEDKHGYQAAAVKIDYDERRKKWYCLVSYSYPRPPAAKECDPDRVMTLHRGVHNFLVAMSSAGHYNVVARGGKLLALKRKLAARRKAMSAIPAGELGTGAKGRGTERRFASRDSLGDKESRAIKTFCQQTAAKVRLLAKQWGTGRIVIGDYGGIDPDEERALRRFVPRFPLYQLKSSLGNALEPLSLELEEVEAEAKFLLFLREFELNREDLWKTAGVAAFDGFLQSTQLCNTARYRNFVAGVRLVHGEAEGIGAAAVIAAGHFRAPTEEATREFVNRCEKFRDVHGVGPSEQTSREWVKQLDQAEPKVVRQASRMRQLEAENQELKANNRKLTRDLALANKEIDKLLKQLGKSKAA